MAVAVVPSFNAHRPGMLHRIVTKLVNLRKRGAVDRTKSGEN